MCVSRNSVRSSVVTQLLFLQNCMQDIFGKVFEIDAHLRIFTMQLLSHYILISHYVLTTEIVRNEQKCIE